MRYRRTWHFRRRDQIMTPTVSRFEELISRFRHTQSTNTARAGAVDPNEFWKRLALKAIDGGYFKSADEFVLFVEACMRYLSFEQVMRDRGYVHGIRNLAEAIARKWACGSAPENPLTSDEIAGLLQSEWVTSGQFSLLRSPGAGRDAE
jgi:hypothetical protein